MVGKNPRKWWKKPSKKTPKTLEFGSEFCVRTLYRDYIFRRRRSRRRWLRFQVKPFVMVHISNIVHPIHFKLEICLHNINILLNLNKEHALLIKGSFWGKKGGILKIVLYSYNIIASCSFSLPIYRFLSTLISY